MITVAIHSPNNPDILIAMHDALHLCGFKTDDEWNKYHNPSIDIGYSDHSVSYYTLLCLDIGMCYFSHDCSPEADEHIDLTRENFGDVLNFVLLCQIWEL